MEGGRKVWREEGMEGERGGNGGREEGMEGERRVWREGGWGKGKERDRRDSKPPFLPRPFTVFQPHTIHKAEGKEVLDTKLTPYILAR